MSNTVKLIVTLSKGQYESLKNIQCGSIGSRMIVNAVMDGVPLDDVKAEIESGGFTDLEGDTYIYVPYAFEILDNIGKSEREEEND